MKFPLATIAALAIALPSLSPSALAQDPLGPPVPVDDQGAARALDGFEKALLRGDPAGVAIKGLQADLDAIPSHPDLRARLNQFIAELRERASSSYLSRADLQMLRRSVADALVDRALDALEDRAEGGQWTFDERATAMQSLASRAALFSAAPDPEQARARLAAAVERAAFEASDVARLQSIVRYELIIDRLAVTEHALADQVMARELSRERFHEIMVQQRLRARMLFLAATREG